MPLFRTPSRLGLLVASTMLIFLLAPAVVSASTAIPHAGNAASACAKTAEGPVDNAFKVAFCNDLVADLNGVGARLGMATITPTNSWNSPVRVKFSSSDGPAGVLFDTKPFVPGPNGVVAQEPCEITAFPSAYSQEKAIGQGLSDRLHVLVVHEVVHCYQNVVVDAYQPGAATGDTLPQWVSEASATYLATNYAGHAEDGTESYWNRWLGKSNLNVTTRSYDAVGWYALVAKVTGDDLWSKMVAAWRSYLRGGASAYITALGGASPAVASAWAPSLLNTAVWGDVWSTPGIGVPSGLQPKTLTLLTTGTASDSVKINALAAVVDDETIDTDGIIEISVTDGAASVHDADGRSYIGFSDEVFCLKSACDATEVSCPGAESPLQLHELTSPFVIAAGGGANPATYVIAKIPTPPSPNAPATIPETDGPCHQAAAPPVPTAAFSEGDPHIQTLNGGSFEFQAAGEYTLARSESGDVDVQVRAEPFANFRTVAVNTAVAAHVVATDVEVDVGDPAVVLVNGKQIKPSKLGARVLAGGGRLAYSTHGDASAVAVSWPDGSKLTVLPDAFGESATFTPPTNGVDAFSGLLSAWVIPKNQATGTIPKAETLIGGDGRRYVVDPSTSAGFKTLYGPFAASWRVTAKTSLFTYSNGKSTRSFDLEGFPTKSMTISSLSSGAKATAKATCTRAGIEDAQLLEDCELDVGATGRSSFATAAGRLQSSVSESPTLPPSAGTTHPASFYFTHPCSVLTTAAIQQVLGKEFTKNINDGSGCFSDLSKVDIVNFSQQSVAGLKALAPGQAGSGPIGSLGHDAYCIVRPTYDPSRSHVVASLGAAGSMEVIANNCTQAAALVKDALSHISGV